MVGFGKMGIEKEIKRLEKVLEHEPHPIVRAIIKDKIEALKQQKNLFSFSIKKGMKV